MLQHPSGERMSYWLQQLHRACMHSLGRHCNRMGLGQRPVKKSYRTALERLMSQAYIFLAKPKMSKISQSKKNISYPYTVALQTIPVLRFLLATLLRTFSVTLQSQMTVQMSLMFPILLQQRAIQSQNNVWLAMSRCIRSLTPRRTPVKMKKMPSYIRPGKKSSKI